MPAPINYQREKAFIRLICHGFTQKEIAHKHNSTELAVAAALKRMRERYGCNTITQLAVKLVLENEI